MNRFSKILNIIQITTISLVVIFAFYSTVVEPSIIITEHVNLPVGIHKKIALLSDVHLGIYKGGDFLATVVKDINKAKVDYVLIAGDLTLFLERPSKQELAEYFAPLKQLKAPVYVIFGNHDLQKPGPYLAQDLADILTSYQIHVLNNDIVKLNGFTLIGLGEYWRNDANVSLFSKLQPEEKSIALIHNPDILSIYEQDHLPTITLAGHVHGGQMRIPWLYKKFIPSRGNYERGYYETPVGTKKTKLFISQGLGETGLPARFLCPPTIYILHL